MYTCNSPCELTSGWSLPGAVEAFSELRRLTPYVVISAWPLLQLSNNNAYLFLVLMRSYYTIVPCKCLWAYVAHTRNIGVGPLWFYSKFAFVFNCCISYFISAVDPVGQPYQVREDTPASRPPIYGPVPPSPAHTSVDQYASYLRSVYTSKKLPTYGKWPPTASKKYIHLAVVKKEKVSKQQADEFTKATLHGDIDDICKKKQEVGFSEVGNKEDGTPAKLILVEGAPGIGKTTFAWEVCRKWAEGEILQEYGLVVLLRLRDKRVREVKCVSDLFYHSDPELQKSVAKEIQYHQGKSVLLLYEGYDELPRRLRIQQSIFLDILHKESLPHATILITSRPSATESLHWNSESRYHSTLKFWALQRMTSFPMCSMS